MVGSAGLQYLLFLMGSPGPTRETKYSLPFNTPLFHMSASVSALSSSTLIRDLNVAFLSIGGL